MRIKDMKSASKFGAHEVVRAPFIRALGIRGMAVVGVLLAGALALAAKGPGKSANGTGSDAKVQAAALTTASAEEAFGRFKALAGDWEAKGTDGKVPRVSYKVVSNGTAVLEQFSEDGNPAMNMVTVYYLDHGQLVLTHYCMANNQPHMRAARFDAASGELDFEFVSAGNLASPNTGHMHTASYHFADGDHFSTRWNYVEGGKPKFSENVEFTRVR